MHPRIRALLSLTALLTTLGGTPARAQEQTARLVKDLNLTPGDLRAEIQWMLPIGNASVFRMDTLAHGAEPWVSDGTPAGTRLLKDILPGPAASNPAQPTSFSNSSRIAFLSERITSGHEIWVTDGTTAGTTLVYKRPTPAATGKLQLRAGTTTGIFFDQASPDLDTATELLFSDGTAAGTRVLNPVDPGTQTQARFTNPLAYATTGARCYFAANGNEIWLSDGTDAGTSMLLAVPDVSLKQLAIVGDRLVMKAVTPAGAQDLLSAPITGGEAISLGIPGSHGQGWYHHAILGDEMFFIRDNYEQQLWVTDGTPAGTRDLPQLHPTGVSNIWPRVLTSWNGAIYFTTQNNDLTELWRTDGTTTGSTRITSLAKQYSNYSILSGTPDYLYFLVTSGPSQASLWRTKGDAASTRPVRGAPPITGSFDGPMSASTGTGFFYSAGQRTEKEALWFIPAKKPKATQLTKPEKSTGSGIGIAPSNVPPYEMTGGNIVTLVQTAKGHEVWSIAPDTSRTRAVWKAKEQLEDWDWKFNFRGTTTHGALFTYENSEDLLELWTTNGKSGKGTRLLARHQLAPGNAYPQDFVQLGHLWFYNLFYYSQPGNNSLWMTDGTQAGTAKVVTADATPIAPNTGELVTFGDSIYFLSTLNGRTALWRSDGTPSGTILVKDTWGDSGQAAGYLTAAADKLLFFVTLSNRLELWQSDGTTAGTLPANAPVHFHHSNVSRAQDLGNGVALFNARSFGSTDIQWWRHDATGTHPIPLAASVPTPYMGHDYYRWQAVAGGRLFYTAAGENEHAGLELWVTDGTAAGTHQVKDIYPGTASSTPFEMLAIGDTIYFRAEDPDHGIELWRSDGTEAGTHLVADIDPGPASSEPAALKLMDGKLYFSAYRRDVGYELFSIDLPAN